MADLPATQQRDVIKEISPPWLSSGTNERYMYNFGLSLDALLEKLNQAMRAHMPGLGPASALPILGRDRVMSQGPNEDDEDFSTRLTRAFDTWKLAGSAQAIMNQVMLYMASVDGTLASDWFPKCVIVSTTSSDGISGYAKWNTYYNSSDLDEAPELARKNPPNWNWDTEFRNWWAWLIYFASGGDLQAGPDWADYTWGDTSISWGLSVAPNFFTPLRVLVRIWKRANTYYPFFIIYFGSPSGVTGDPYSPNSSPGAGNPDGTWGRWGTVVNGVRVPSRNASSRFVDGTGVYESCCVHTGT